MAIDNKRLGQAKLAKQDEFYTQLSDIENEMRHYKKHFKDKTVFCNCDDPFESNFFKFFVLNFNRLGLKKLIATCYSESPIAGNQLSLFDVIGNESKADTPYRAIVTSVYDVTGDGGIDMFDVAELFRSGENTLEELQFDGDFRSAECLELLEEADIVVTNPPFSLFRDYVSTLISYKKQFIIIGSMNAIKYKEVFPLIKNNEMWLGHKSLSGGMDMIVPDKVFDSNKVTKYHVNERGEKIVNVMGVCWFTNLDIKKRHENLILIKRYDPGSYPTYSNYDAIEVQRVADIPCDYAGKIGVPITFMDKYNPDQFEIIGYACGHLGQSIGVGDIPHEHKARMKGHSAAGDIYYIDKDGIPQVPYARIIVRNKHPEQPKD